MAIQAQGEVPPNNQRLISQGKQLVDGHLLADYGITENATLHLILRLGGD